MPKKPTKPQTDSALPAGVRDTDLKWSAKESTLHHLTFYNTTAFGWCIATLDIRRARAGRTARVYAARVSDGASVRVGAGPHVKQTITVYVRESRLKDLQKYVDMHNKGNEEANVIRDRISSRRAQGALMRAQGRSSWRWNV